MIQLLYFTCVFLLVRPFHWHQGQDHLFEVKVKYQGRLFQNMAVAWALSSNFLPNDKILGLSKLKALTDNKFNIVKMMISVFDRVENIVEKGENAGYQQFLLFPQCFPKPSF